MVTVITHDDRKLQFAEGDSFEVWPAERDNQGFVPNHVPYVPNHDQKYSLIVKRTYEPVPQPQSPNMPYKSPIEPYDVVGRVDWDDVLAVAVGEVHRG